MQISKKKIKGFTLVELIVVITILAILSTISFISFQNYTKNARDSNRVSSMSTLEIGLELSQMTTKKYPLPDENSGKILTGGLLIEGEEIEYSYLGIIGEGVSKILKLNTVPKDPQTGNNYVYAVTKDQKKYQLAGTLESEFTYNKLKIIPQTYANNANQRARVIGNHKMEVIISNNTGNYLTIVPSLIFDPTSETRILNSTGVILITNNGKNIPYSIGGILNNEKKSSEIIKELRGSEAEIITLKLPTKEELKTMTGGEILSKLKELNNEYENNTIIETTLGAIGNGEVNFQVIEQVIRGTSGGTISPVVSYENCEFNGVVVEHGTNIIAYLTGGTLPYGSTCTSEVRECTNGILSGSYTNADCNIAGATGTFNLSSTNVQAGTQVTITNNCSQAPSSYTSSNESVATIAGTTITTISAGTTNITPVGGACGDNDGKTLTVTVPTCTSWTYSAWGICQPNNTQTRTVVTSSPNGCTGGSPVLSQSCTYSWRSEDQNCTVDDIVVGSQTWAGCNSTLGNGFERGQPTSSINSCYKNHDGIHNMDDCREPHFWGYNDKLYSNSNPKTWFPGTNGNLDGTHNTIWGKLYTRDNATSACPSGWHVPTDVEWATLENTLKGSVCRDVTQVGDADGDGKGNGWECSGLGWRRNGSTSTNNLAERLKIPLAGYRDTDGATFYDRGNTATLWSSSESGGSAYRRSLNWNFSTTYRNLNSKAYGFSVRCLKD